MATNYIDTLLPFFKAFYKKELKNNDNLFILGVLDSIGIVSLISYIEEKTGLTIEPEEITEENFASLDNINKLLQTKK